MPAMLLSAPQRLLPEAFLRLFRAAPYLPSPPCSADPTQNWPSRHAARVGDTPIRTAGSSLMWMTMLSFKAGVFGAIGPPKAVSHALWGKTTTQYPEFEMRF